MHMVFGIISCGYLSDRTYIEQELLQKSTFSSIEKNLHKDPTTISKEVKRYRKSVPAKHSYRSEYNGVITCKF